jgi:hypothetical protein
MPAAISSIVLLSSLTYIHLDLYIRQLGWSASGSAILVLARLARGKKTVRVADSSRGLSDLLSDKSEGRLEMFRWVGSDYRIAIVARKSLSYGYGVNDGLQVRQRNHVYRFQHVGFRHVGSSC